MQFHIFAPVIFVPFLRSKGLGIAIWSVALAAHFAISGTVTAVYDLPDGMTVAFTNVTDENRLWRYYIHYYDKPWTRIGPYLIGMAAGWMLLEVQQRRPTLKWWQVVVGWTSAIAVSLTLIFSLVDENGGRVKLSMPMTMLYNMFA